MSTPPPTLAPATWYSVTAQCVNTGGNCPLGVAGTVKTIRRFFSNDGVNYWVVCGQCGNYMTLLTAVLLDPQPIPE